jgi:hypothetical protein
MSVSYEQLGPELQAMLSQLPNETHFPGYQYQSGEQETRAALRQGINHKLKNLLFEKDVKIPVNWTFDEISSEVIGDNSDSPSSDFFIIYKDLVEAKDRSFWFEAAYDFIQLLCYSE